MSEAAFAALAVPLDGACVEHVAGTPLEPNGRAVDAVRRGAVTPNGVTPIGVTPIGVVPIFREGRGRGPVGESDAGNFRGGGGGSGGGGRRGVLTCCTKVFILAPTLPAMPACNCLPSRNTLSYSQGTSFGQGY